MSLESIKPTRYDLANGVHLHAVRGGAQIGSASTVIFIHGAMGDWRAWEPQWEAFTKEFDCVSYSRRYSFPNENNQDASHHNAIDEAQDLLHLMDAMKVSQAHLVGSSYGGFTALALATLSPERILSLISVEAPMMKYAMLNEADAAIAQAFRTETIEPANAAFRAGHDALAAQIMTGGINGSAQDPNSPAMLRRMQNCRAMKALALSSDEFPWLEAERLRNVKLPMLLLSGENTAPVHAAIFRNVVAALPAAQKAIVAGAGHGVSREQPAQFNRTVMQFIQSFILAT